MVIEPSPTSTVWIKDSLSGAPRKVDNIPFVLAFGASVVSSLGNGLTQMIEENFQSPPNESVGGIGITGNPISMYSKTGFMFGAEAINSMKKIEFANADFEQNMYGFVNQCITYDAMIGYKYTLHDLKHSSNIWALVSDRPSKLRGFPWRNVNRDGGRFQGSNTEIVTCSEGIRRFNEHWGKMTESSLSNLLKHISIAQAWKKNPKNEHEHLNDHVKAYLPGALDSLSQKSQSAVDHVKQQLMISAVLKGNEQKLMELGGSPNFEVRRAYFQTLESQKTIGHVIAQSLPSVKNVLEALLYCLFLFVIVFILLPDGTKFLWFYFKILFWLQLWAPLFAILNFIMMEAMSWKAITALKGDDGITLGNFVGLANMADGMASVAGYLCASIPMLSWMLLERGGYAFSSMASSILGVAQGSASQAAIEKTSGNYSFGNTSFDNHQLGNASQYKQDYAPIYTSGFTAVNDGASSLLTTSSGEQILTMNESKIPVSLNAAQSQETALRNAQRDAYSFSESEQQSSTKSYQNAQNQYLEIGKQASMMQSQGVQIGDQQQAQVLKEAASHYNKLEEISNKTALSKEYINQKAIELNGEISSSGLPKALGSLVSSVSAELGLSGNKSETSHMSASQAAEDIFNLSKQTQFNETHQRMNNAFKNRSFDTNNQELKQSTNNFSSAFEEAKRHEENASKSFEKAKSLDHEIAFTQSNAATINASYSQEFVNEMGAEELKRMDVERQKQKAFNYMQYKGIMESRFPMPKRETSQSLEGAYEGSTHDQKYGNQDSLKTNHQTFEKEIYNPKKQQGINKLDERSLNYSVERDINHEQNKANDAEMGSKREHFRARQTIDMDHAKHAEDNMGIFQEGVTKDLLKSHKEKKGND
jgi:conjugal transfer mating pair stabilization protein TraG